MISYSHFLHNWISCASASWNYELEMEVEKNLLGFREKRAERNFRNNLVQLHFAITLAKSKVLQNLHYYFYNSTVQCNIFFSVEIIYVLLAVRLMIAAIWCFTRSPIALFLHYLCSYACLCFFLRFRLSFHEKLMLYWRLIISPAVRAMPCKAFVFYLLFTENFLIENQGKALIIVYYPSFACFALF